MNTLYRLFITGSALAIGSGISILNLEAAAFGQERSLQPRESQQLDEGSPATTLTFNEAVDRALNNSPLIRRSQAEYEAQIEKRRGAWSDAGPRVSAEYNQVYFDEKQTTNFGGQEIVLRDDKSKTGSLIVAQPITGLFALVDKAVYEGVQEDLKETSFKYSRTSTAFDASEAYLKAFQAEEQLRVAEQSIQAVTSQLNDAEALERAGRINSGDLLKIKLAVSESKARAAQARAAKEIAFAYLGEMLGLPQGSSFAIEKQEIQTNAASEVIPELNEAYSQALSQRLDYQQAKQGQRAASFSKDLAYARFSPTLNAFVKWDKNFGEPSGMSGGEKGEVTRSYGLQFQWDIWNNGSQVFGLREAMSQQQAAAAQVEGFERQLRLDVVQTIASLRAAKEGLELAEVAVQQAEEAFRIEQVRFKSGSRSATDVVLAETSQSGARGRLVTARTDLVLWQLRLQKALGKDKPVL